MGPRPQSSTPAGRLSSEQARRALARLGYGARPAEADDLSAGSLQDWLEFQFALPAVEPAVERRLAEATLHIRYPASEGVTAVDERRPLRLLNASQAERWKIVEDFQNLPGAERDRPRAELSAATLIRKVHAEGQIRERMVEFWHDHFSVSASNGTTISVSLPDYDQRIRRHALGNFRSLLEDIASSPAMLFYLNGQSSRSGAPNENYARELLELHTLGRGAYFGASANNRSVPRLADGRPSGYVDADVWEAARAFTGWTVANGQRVDARQTLPRNGGFAYVEQWHDGHQKHFMGVQIDAFRAPRADAVAVLDILARHPATATFVCGKIARWLIGEGVPNAVISRSADAFVRHAEQPDQMVRVLRAMLLEGSEVLDAGAGRIRRPIDFVVAFARAFSVPLTPSPRLIGEFASAGQPMFSWPTPDGQPIAASQYLGAASMRQRWFIAHALATNAWQTGMSPFLVQLAGRGPAEVAGILATAALGGAGREVANAIAGAWRSENRSQSLSPEEVAEVAGWIAASPAFQVT